MIQTLDSRLIFHLSKAIEIQFILENFIFEHVPCGNARICEGFFKKSSSALFHSVSLATYDNVVNANLVRKIWFTRVYANQRFDF